MTPRQEYIDARVEQNRMKPLRAYLNVGRLRANARLRRSTIGNFPVRAYIEPTLFCNLRCPACPTGLQLGLRPSTSIDVDLFKRTIDEVGDYLFDLYMYNWGEPLLHKQTPEMIAYAKRKNIRIRLSTNLSFKLTDSYIDRLAASGLDDLVVSLDGTSPETYSKYRVRGDYSLVRENMRRLQDAKIRLGTTTPKIIWQFLVFRHNEHEIEEARERFREWGADELYIFGAEMPLAPYDEGFAPSTIPEFNQYHEQHQYHETVKAREGKPCSWLYGVLVMNPDGRISPCCSTPDAADDFGEYSSSFFQAFNSEKFRRAREIVTGKRGGGSKKTTKTLQTSLPIFGQPEGGELLCERCPIPHRQDEADAVIAAETLRLWGEIRDGALKVRGRALLAYLLMGMPDWRSHVPQAARLFVHRAGNRFPKLKATAFHIIGRDVRNASG